MGNRGMVARRAPGADRGAHAAFPRRGIADRRRAPSARPGRIARRGRERPDPTAGHDRASVGRPELRFVLGHEDGLDPGFDELGDLHEHVDGLASWWRRGRASPGRAGDGPDED